MINIQYCGTGYDRCKGKLHLVFCIGVFGWFLDEQKGRLKSISAERNSFNQPVTDDASASVDDLHP